MQLMSFHAGLFQFNFQVHFQHLRVFLLDSFIASGIGGNRTIIPHTGQECNPTIEIFHEKVVGNIGRTAASFTAIWYGGEP